MIGGVSLEQNTMVEVLEPQRFDVELQGTSLLLLAFLKRNERFRSQTDVLTRACSGFGYPLECFVYDFDYLDTAMERFKIKGTPTFLLFSEGQEVNRLIGETDSESLEEFVRSSLEGDVTTRL